jgi:hypothetical protein
MSTSDESNGLALLQVLSSIEPEALEQVFREIAENRGHAPKLLREILDEHLRHCTFPGRRWQKADPRNAGEALLGHAFAELTRGQEEFATACLEVWRWSQKSAIGAAREVLKENSADMRTSLLIVGPSRVRGCRPRRNCRTRRSKR